MAKTFQDLLNEGQAKVLGIVSIVPMDDWNTDTQYQKLNLVRHNGAAYLAKGGSKNVEPGVTQDWQSSWMLVYLDGILSPDGTYPNLTAGRVMHALAWGNKNYDGSSAQTITAADLGLADVYKPQGSIAFASLPATPNESNYGYVWNITNDFTTDSRFIEGVGKKYSAGTNVGVINQDGQYYYDILGNFVDLSNYAKIDGNYQEMTVGQATNAQNAANVTSQINGHAISDIFETDGTTVKNATQAQRASADENGNNIVATYAKQNGSYPTLGAGYLPNNKILLGTSGLGWWKIGSVNYSDIGRTNVSFSVILLINGLHPDQNTGNTAGQSGKIEVDFRTLPSGSGFSYARVSILSGNLREEDICVTYSGTTAYVYYHLEESYESIQVIKVGECSNNTVINETLPIFNFENTNVGTTAPSGAVYAVNRNVAAKGVTPATGSNSDDVATTEWVNDVLPHLYLHRITVTTVDGTVGAARFMWLSTSATAYTLASLCRTIYSNYSTNAGRIIPATGSWFGDGNKYYMTTYVNVTSATTAIVYGIAQYISGNNLSHTSGTADVESISDTVTQLF